MSEGIEAIWPALPERTLHPLRVPVVEALRWIAEPLSAIALVDVLDSYVTMRDAAYHLRVLERLGVAQPEPPGGDALTGRDLFDLPYRLRAHDGG